MLYLKRKSGGVSGYFVKKRNSHKNNFPHNYRSMDVTLQEVLLQKLKLANDIFISMN